MIPQLILENLCAGQAENSRINWGSNKCIEGDGTEANPYKFETYYEISVAGVTSGETTTNYADFAEALEAWTADSTLTLLEDVEITSTINVSASKTLDLNGHGIKMTGTGRVIYVSNNAKENPAVSYEKGKNAVKLTWDKVEGAQKYAVCGYADGKWTILAEGFGNSYVMKDLKTGAEYKVAVAAMINGKWNTDFSNAIIVSPKEKRVPEYPTVKAQAYKDRFRVQWTAVEGAQKYGLAVYQKGKWVPKVQFDADTTEYISPSLKKDDYKCVIAAKVDGEWELGEADSRAFTVSIF
ncbi:MAG: hypothetical protein K6B74_13485 [Ruminococcus sp.]|nr:hypothetical protein [Ruminococcus sp.]